MSTYSQELKSDFLAYLRDIRGYPQTTVSTYEIALRQALEVSEFFEDGTRWVFDITPFRLKIRRNHKKTIAKKLSAIHSFVSYLRKQREMEIKLISDEAIKAPKTLPKPIEGEHIKEILSTATLQERLIIEMLYGLGLRISELSSVKLADIQTSWITILGKGGNQRQLPLLPAVASTIESYKDYYHPKLHLFEKNGSAMNQAQLRYIMTKCFKAKGIKATPHQLRHSFATDLLNNGARISDVSELLGHSTMVSTQIYTKLADSKKLREYLGAHPLAKREE